MNNMIVIILDNNSCSIDIIRVETEEEIWDSFKESECSWMEIQDVTEVLSAVTSFMYEEGIGV